MVSGAVIWGPGSLVEAAVPVSPTEGLQAGKCTRGVVVPLRGFYFCLLFFWC